MSAAEMVQFRDLAERNHRVLVIVRLNGRMRTACEHARAMRGNEQELKPIGYFVDAILDGHARHGLFPL
jgi:hypothetical protein